MGKLLIYLMVLLNGQFYFMDIPEILDEKDWAANLNFNFLTQESKWRMFIMNLEMDFVWKNNLCDFSDMIFM